MPKGIYIRTEEMNRSMSLATKGHRVSEETKKKMSLNHIGMSGKCHSKETKRKMSVIRKGKSNGRQGKSYSEETKKKISESHLNKPILKFPYCFLESKSSQNILYLGYIDRKYFII